jgi:RNA polymerase sigma factor (sigma-70 family)
VTPEQNLEFARALKQLVRKPEDQEAWQTVFGYSWPTAVTTANWVFRGVVDLAEDSAQSAFARILQYGDLHELQEPAAFLAYLKAVCRRVARDDLTRLARHTGHASFEELESVREFPATTPTPEEQFAALEMEGELAKELNENEKVLLQLLLEGYGVSEIQERLGLPYSAVGVRIFRLREKLAKYMKDKGLK